MTAYTIYNVEGAPLHSYGKTVRECAEDAVRKGVSLCRAWLDGARLEGARLNCAELDGAWLHYAKLDGAWLNGAKLNGAKLDGSRLDGACLDGVIGLRLLPVADPRGVHMVRRCCKSSLESTRRLPEFFYCRCPPALVRAVICRAAERPRDGTAGP